jgi:hypothetical protein
MSVLYVLFSMQRHMMLCCVTRALEHTTLKVPKCEIFHLFDFNEFYGVKSL